ncbi:MAG: 30S ribosomal protein S8 [Planctomycetota bacterium]|nr:30S ribosomal protein S8 [Planctomycetota bacterium]
MNSTDPIADMLTVIRNGVRVRRGEVTVPASRIKTAVVEVLKREGFIAGFEIEKHRPQDRLRIRLKYGNSGESAITAIRRISKPGRRVYWGKDDIQPVLRGIGISIISTPKGVLSDREARKASVGGEVICQVW